MHAIILFLLFSLCGSFSLKRTHVKSYFKLQPTTYSMTASNNGESYNELLRNISKNLKKGSVIVIKYGGHAMENDQLKSSFAEDVGALCNLGIFPVIVHGGGPQIKKMLKSLDVESTFVQGLRVTDAKTMEIAQMVLCGSINKDIVAMISSQPNIPGALGLCGLDAKLIEAKKLEMYQADPVTGVSELVDIGLVGEPIRVNSDLLRSVISLHLVPVIAPIGYNTADSVYESGNGRALNINADTAAGAVAEALKADRLLLLTDVTGVLDKEKNLITTMKAGNLDDLINDGTISGGMIPKLRTAAQAVAAGVTTVAVMDGREKHAILRALSGEIFGTQITV